VSRYPVPLNDPPDMPLPSVSKAVARQARQASETTELELYKYSLGAGARTQMAQCDFEAHREAARSAISSEISLLKEGLLEAGTSPAAVEIVAGWVSDVRHADQRRFRHFFGV
jgi:hypothetical protein